MKIKTIAATALTAITIIGASPMSSMAVSYEKPITSADYYRIAFPSSYRDCNDYNRMINIGDANEDGRVNLADVIKIRNVAINGFTPPTPKDWDAAFYQFFNQDKCYKPDHMDIDGDGAVTKRDADILLSFCTTYAPADPIYRIRN